MKILRYFLWLLVAAVAAAIAIANRDPVTLSLWPLPYVWPMPLYALLFATLIAGGLIGGLASWLARARPGVAKKRGQTETEDLPAG